MGFMKYIELEVVLDFEFKICCYICLRNDTTTKILQAANLSKEECLFSPVFEDQSLNMGDFPTTTTYFASAEGSRWHHTKAEIYVGTRCYDSNRSRKRKRIKWQTWSLSTIKKTQWVAQRLSHIPRDLKISLETLPLCTVPTLSPECPWHDKGIPITPKHLNYFRDEIQVWTWNSCFGLGFFQCPWKPEVSDPLGTVL